MKVLIVDDSEQMRQLERTYIESLADDIRECADGSEALAVYTNFEPDWVLMDWKMKEMDGLTATQQIMKSYPQARILFITQFDDDFLRQSAREAGAYGYLLKEDLSGLRSIITKEINFW